jgi:hypothetical protein
MARLQILRRIASFSVSSSLECLGVPCRGFTSNRYTVSNSWLVNERRGTSKVVVARWDMVGHFEASGIRTFAAESSGNGGDEKPHQETKIDGGKKYSVVQIDSDGSWRTVWRNAVELVSTKLLTLFSQVGVQ